MKENRSSSHIKTPERYDRTTDHTSEVYLRSKLNDAYSELENLKSVIKEIKTVDRVPGHYETETYKHRSSSQILGNSSINRYSNSNLSNKQTYEVINQFKDTLKETEKFINRTESMPKLSPTRMT